jgi:ariadne-1
MCVCVLQLYEMVRLKMEELQNLGMSWIEVQFLQRAVDVLCQCRQTLMYTYVFAFYLRKNNQSIIFEVSPDVHLISIVDIWLSVE